MAECIVVQVGQCGNQIGSRFWDLSLKELCALKKDSHAETTSECFFRKCRPKSNNAKPALKARAVLADMEERVVNSLYRGSYGPLFDTTQKLTDVSGSGNNWAVGHYFYGSQYRERILDLVRKEAEHCDSLQTFFLLHSMGGGTGSGFGTAITKFLADEFPEVQRFVIAVFPSENDDVITSPYNCVLATGVLTEFADCVLPIENQSLLDIWLRVQRGRYHTAQTSAVTSSGQLSSRSQNPYDQMNNIVANLFLNMTSHARFPGGLSMDMNDIVTNLVPFPKMQYVMANLAPLCTLADVHLPPRKLDQMFTEAFTSHHYLVRTHPKPSVNLACALLVRGGVRISDLQRNIERLQVGMNFPWWNKQCWKTGLCITPPVGHPYSLVALTNSTAIAHNLSAISSSFLKLYRKKAHMHHFLKVDEMEVQQFEESFTSLNNLIGEYKAHNTMAKSSAPPRSKAIT